MEIMAIGLEAIGAIIIAVIVLRVHWRILKEHKVNDPDVWREIKLEQKLGIIGVLLLVAGFSMQIINKL
ncbi:hypothetical protein KA005_63800 [bacterium]|nr:hypothetical protein [bacterium]